MRGKLRSIQAMRALAVSAVVFAHATDFPIGAAGVDLFFVISGLIIGSVMKGRQAKHFAADRIWRIFPMYYLNLVPWLIAGAASGSLRPARLASSITLWPIWGAFLQPYLLPAWTLTFETLFYAGATVALATRRPIIPLALFGCAFGLSRVVESPVLSFLGNPIIFEFLAGLIILRLPKRPMIGLALLPFVIGLVALSPLDIRDGEAVFNNIAPIARALWWGVPVGIIVYTAVSWEHAFSWRPLSGVVFLGDASYSIYLIHVLINVRFWFLPWPLRVMFIVLAGCAMHRWIEKPLLRLRQKVQPAKGGTKLFDGVRNLRAPR